MIPDSDKVIKCLSRVSFMVSWHILLLMSAESQSSEGFR